MYIEENEILSNTPRIEVRLSTPSEEYDRLTSYLRKLAWYKERGYKLKLPDHPTFAQLREPGSDLSVLESVELRDLYAREVYDLSAYQHKLNDVNADLPQIQQGILRFNKFYLDWGFKLFTRYEIIITCYTPGGSYDDEKGQLFIGATSNKSPKEILLHEGVHTGIEQLIVQKFGLKHEEKERVVDLVCCIVFSDLLPNYTFQNVGEPKLDSYITPETLPNLPHVISRYVVDFPRET